MGVREETERLGQLAAEKLKTDTIRYAAQQLVDICMDAITSLDIIEDEKRHLVQMVSDGLLQAADMGKKGEVDGG